jgi:hypothetical protein
MRCALHLPGISTGKGPFIYEIKPKPKDKGFLLYELSILYRQSLNPGRKAIYGRAT